MFSLAKSLKKAQMAQLAEILFPDEDERKRIWTLTFGEQGELGPYLGQDTIDDLAELLISVWQKTEWYPAEEREYLLSLHKHIHKGKNDTEVGVEVNVMPDGYIIIFVSHMLGFGHAVDFCMVNHAMIVWEANTRKWLVHKFDSFLKMSLLGKVEPSQEGLLELEQLLANVSALRTKSFGKLENAMKEAFTYTRLGYISLKDKSEYLVDLKKAKATFNAIPNLSGLEPDFDSMFNFALEEAKNVPSLFDLDQMIEGAILNN